MPAAAPRARPRARPRVAPPARAGATAASWTSATAAGGGRRAGRDAEAAGDAEHRKKSHPERAAVPYVLRRASPHTAASAARMRPPLGMALAAKVAQGRSVVRGLSSSALRKRSQSRLRRPAGADSRRPPSSSEAAAASPRSARRTIRVAGRGVAATRLGGRSVGRSVLRVAATPRPAPDGQDVVSSGRSGSQPRGRSVPAPAEASPRRRLPGTCASANRVIARPRISINRRGDVPS